MKIELYEHQKKALDSLRSGSILCGGVGSGKSRTALAYYWTKECGGNLDIEKCDLKSMAKNIRPLYIITTARKRDTHEWDSECLNFLLTCDKKSSFLNTEVIIDSWNNISKYESVKESFFIFDEQRVTGSGQWVKHFLTIAKNNKWILLSATPGDTWIDYIPVFIANGYYKNRTEFKLRHVVYSRYSKFPKVERYLEEDRLRRLQKEVLVYMPFKKPAEQHHMDIMCQYDLYSMNLALKSRWNPYTNEPITDISELCSVMRKVANSDPSRISAVLDILKDHPKLIIFYSFDYELDLLRSIDIPKGEWNGHKHESIPSTDSWIYLVQYNSGCEGWNCTETDSMIFYSQSYSYKMMTQAAGRIDRLNTPYTDLHYYHLISRSQIDIMINRALRQKKNFNEKSLDFK